ncbi:MAG: 1,4-dihydroxy-6-naphtoate synthase [Desulfovibrio sp.]
MRLSLGLSPCPNDTYIFAALLEGRSPLPKGVAALDPHFADVEELNALAQCGRLDVTKISASAVAEVSADYVVLHSGGALGRGCGPLLVALQAGTPEDFRAARIAVPGFLTTANLLLSLTGMFDGPREERVFDAIMPALEKREFDAGVIIHESRFTYPDHGLSLVLDLGKWWEDVTGAPIPLGVIVAKRSLGEKTIRAIDAAIRHSLERANAFPGEGMPFIRARAQEMDESVLRRHIAMFVNEFSLSLGEEGRKAVTELAARAAALRHVPSNTNPLFAPL